MDGKSIQLEHGVVCHPVSTGELEGGLDVGGSLDGKNVRALLRLGTRTVGIGAPRPRRLS